MNKDPVKDIRLTSDTKLSDLIRQFGEAGGFVASKVSTASSIVKKNLLMCGPVVKIFLFFLYISFHIGKTEPVDQATFPYLTHKNFVMELLLAFKNNFSIVALLNP